jgi:hypothetical protein
MSLHNDVSGGVPAETARAAFPRGIRACGSGRRSGRCSPTPPRGSVSRPGDARPRPRGGWRWFRCRSSGTTCPIGRPRMRYADASRETTPWVWSRPIRGSTLRCRASSAPGWWPAAPNRGSSRSRWPRSGMPAGPGAGTSAHRPHPRTGRDRRAQPVGAGRGEGASGAQRAGQGRSGLHPRAGPTRVGRPVGHRSGNTTCPRARPNAGRGPSGLAGMGSGCSRRCSPRAPRLRRRPYRRSSGRGARVHPYRSDNGQVRLRDVKDLPRPRYGGRFLRCGLHRLGGPGASAAMGPKRATTVPARMRGKRRRCRLNRGDPHPGHRRRCRGHRPHPRPACHPAVASRWQWGDTGSTSGAAGDRPPPLWPRPGPVQVPAGRQAREQTGFAPEDLPLGFEPASYLPARGAPAGGAVRVRLR